MRTKMSKADATRTVEALFDDKGISPQSLKKGQVQITGFGNSNAQGAARRVRNPKTGGVHSDQGVDRSVPRGEAAKMAVNNKK